MHRTSLGIALLSLLAISAAARADTYEYTLNASQFFQGAGFDYTTSSLLTTFTSVTGDCSDSYQETCLGFDLDPTTGIYEIVFTPNNGVAALSSTLNEPVLAAGTYTSLEDSISTTLVITDIPAAVTPEPSGLLLLGTGALGAISVARRRHLRA